MWNHFKVRHSRKGTGQKNWQKKLQKVTWVWCTQKKGLIPLNRFDNLSSFHRDGFHSKEIVIFKIKPWKLKTQVIETVKAKNRGIWTSTFRCWSCAEQEGLEINKQDEFDLERKARLKIHENMKIVLSIVFLFTWIINSESKNCC